MGRIDEEFVVAVRLRSRSIGDLRALPRGKFASSMERDKAHSMVHSTDWTNDVLKNVHIGMPVSFSFPRPCDCSWARSAGSARQRAGSGDQFPNQETQASE
jgi:hypothetical protein